MGITEIVLIVFIIVLGIFCLGDKQNPPRQNKPSQTDKDIARLRQMKEWDRFDDNANSHKKN